MLVQTRTGQHDGGVAQGIGGVAQRTASDHHAVQFSHLIAVGRRWLGVAAVAGGRGVGFGVGCRRVLPGGVGVGCKCECEAKG